MFLAPLPALGPGSAIAAHPCPDVSGRYSVTGFSDALGEAMEVMQARQAGFLDSGVELHGATDGELTIGVKSGSSGVWSTSPVAVLIKGHDFDCKDGSLVFRALADTHRKPDDATWYKGASTISLSAHGGELAIDVSFTGRQRISLFSYESADISIPRPGTRTTLKDAIRWPAYAEPVVVAPVPPTAEDSVRGLLTSQVLGNVRMGWVGTGAKGVEVTFNAPQGDDVAPFQERLRAASIDYTITVAPIWSNNAYCMELLIQPGQR